jgi:hypothetical protein
VVPAGINDPGYNRDWESQRPTLNSSCNLLPDGYADDEEDQAYREEQEEQELGDARRGRSDSSESQKCRD